MTTTIASGLGSTLGIGTEVTVGTAVTPTRFLPFQKNTLVFKPTKIQDASLHGGLYELGSGYVMTTGTVDGGIDMAMYDRGLGILLQQMLGGVPVITGPTTGVYTHVYQPGNPTGMALTVQAAKPTTAGTIVPFTWRGCKVTDWTLDVKVGGFVSLSLTLDGMAESIVTTYTAPSYVANTNLFNFREASYLTLGGTATTTSGVTSVSGGTAASSVTDFQLKGKLALDVNRFHLGDGGVKSEQLANAFWSITGMIGAEFANTTDLLTQFYADTPMPAQISFTGPVIGTGSTHSSLGIICPHIRLDNASPTIDGPAILKVSSTFQVKDDGVNPVTQWTLATLDPTV